MTKLSRALGLFVTMGWAAAACAVDVTDETTAGARQASVGISCVGQTAGTLCGLIMCIAGDVVKRECNGSGECMSVTVDCGEYACQNGVCRVACTTDQNCKPDAFCQAGICKAKGGLGEACTIDAGCKSTHCYIPENQSTGVCCTEFCDGPCETCLKSEMEVVGGLQPSSGTCKPIKAGTNPKDLCADSELECGAPGWCDGQARKTCQQYEKEAQPCSTTTCVEHPEGAVVTSAQSCDGLGNCNTNSAGAAPCKITTCDGDACASTCSAQAPCAVGYYCDAATSQCEPMKLTTAPCATSVECDTGICADGYCCNTECSGVCQACDVPGAEGTCTAVPHGTLPRGGKSCGDTPDADKPCEQLACDGSTIDACKAFVGGWRSCGETSCVEDDGWTVGTVNKGCKDGLCDQIANSCSGFVCNESKTACKVECDKDEDCVSGLTCNDHGRCAEASCSGKWNVSRQDPTGTVDKAYCMGYRCEDSVCRDQCQSNDDCDETQGYLCDAARERCVQGAPPADDPGAPGCSCSLAAERTPFGWLSLLGVVALGMRRRRYPHRLSGAVAPPAAPGA